MSETINNHRKRVFDYMSTLSKEVMRRGNEHDLSKYEKEEYPVYEQFTAEFSKHPFGSEGYNRIKEAMASAIQHHYQHNRHHPEHFPDGIEGMNLVDLLEMICDWKSATQNHPETPGDMGKSLQVAIQKYNISPQLAKILYNTMRDFELT